MKRLLPSRHLRRSESGEGFFSFILILASFLVIAFVIRQAKDATRPEAITAAQNVKGWFFILITSAMLYLLVQEHFRTLKNKHRELVESYDQTIRGWIEVMDLRHHETRNHTERVTRMTVAFARLAGVNPERLERIARGATLHDIGKIGIPDSILIKPGKLDPDEWALMQTHPDIGRELLEKISFLRPCIDIPWCHHEKWDGSGYPRGLRGAGASQPSSRPHVRGWRSARRVRRVGSRRRKRLWLRLGLRGCGCGGTSDIGGCIRNGVPPRVRHEGRWKKKNLHLKPALPKYYHFPMGTNPNKRHFLDQRHYIVVVKLV